MEGARSVAITILKEIDDQQSEITEQQIKEASSRKNVFSIDHCSAAAYLQESNWLNYKQGRGEAVLPPSECAKKLKRLAAKLDGLIPYLTLTLTAYQLPTSKSTSE